MTSTIEQTKREMFKALADLRGRITINYSIKDMLRGADELDNAMEEYLEQLRQQIAEQADTIRVMELASQTSAEVIRGLREELDKPSFGENCTIRHDDEASKNAKTAAILEALTLSQGSKRNVSGEAIGPISANILLKAVRECQNIVTLWAKGELKAKKAIYAISSEVNGNTIVLQVIRNAEQNQA